ISLKGYVSSEKKVRVVIWNEKTTGKLMWESPERTVNGDVSESFNQTIPLTWPSSGSQSGADYKIFAMIDDDFFTSSEFILAGTLEGDSTAPVVAVTTFTFGIVNSTSAILNWTKASDESSDVTNLQYQVFSSTSNNIDTIENIEKNGTKLGIYTKDIATLTIADLSPDTTYYFNVIVMDEAGNKTAYTSGSTKTATSAVPVISSCTLAGNNSYIDVVFNKALYNTSVATGALEVTDFTMTFVQNGDLITNVAISSIKKDDNIIEGSALALSGGESTIRFFLDITNQPSNGLATVEIKPVDSTSIYDVDGVGMLDTQTTGANLMNDNAIFGIVSGTLDSDNTYIELDLTEGGYNTNAGGAIELNDFTISFVKGSDVVTGVAVLSVKDKDGNALAGGETTIKVFLNITGGPSNGNGTIEVKPFDNSSIYTFGGSVMAISKTTGIKTLNDLKTPLISSGTISSDNSYIDIVLDEACYNTDGESGALEASDFDLAFLQVGDDVTNVEIRSIKQNDSAVEGSATALLGSETTIRAFLTVTTGPSSGHATIEITPKDGTSIYDAAGNAMAITQTTSAQPLKDLKTPLIISSGTVSDANTYVDIIFSEGGFNASGGALEVDDFSLTFVQGDDDVTNVMVLSVVNKENGDALVGGESAVRVFLAVTDGPSTGDGTIEIKPVDGSSIYDTVGNVMEATQSTGVKYLKDLKLATITSASVAVDNSYIDIIFSEGIFGDINQSTAINSLDFLITHNLIGDNVTDVTISSAKQNDKTVEGEAADLIGGESVIRVFLTIDNPPSNGSGKFEIKPANGTSIYDSGGNATLATETTGEKTFTVTEGANITSGILALDNSFIVITFDDAVYNTNGGAGALESGDFGITFTQGDGSATNVAIVSVSQEDETVLEGGETKIRVNLTVTGTPNAVETINIKPADGSSIYNAAGNPAAITETTGDLTLNDPGFEGYAGVSYSPWTEIETSGDVVVDTVIVRSGSQSCRLQNPTGGYDRGMKSIKIPILGNQSYTYSVWGYANDEGGSAADLKISFRLEYSNSDGTSQTGASFVSFATWKEFTWTKDSPADATWVEISIRAKETTTKDQDIIIDDVAITKN
ncbi:hypothetical protein KAJ27_20845, partial [bacterium]|nr:hypothetical protein [bacterium]